MLENNNILQERITPSSINVYKKILIAVYNNNED